MKVKIKKGKHFASNLRFRPYFGKRVIKWKVNLDISCLYPAINDDSGDLNKLCGVSFGHHHQNSLRFAWRPDFNHRGQIMICAYWYADGQQGSAYIGSIIHNTDYIVEIIMGEPLVASTGEPLVQFILKRINNNFQGEKNFAVVKYNLPRLQLGYYLWPYFGGNNTAPHDMRIDIDVL